MNSKMITPLSYFPAVQASCRWPWANFLHWSSKRVFTQLKKIVINLFGIGRVNNIPTKQFLIGISKNTQPKSYMLSLTECVWEFLNNALWDTHKLSPQTVRKGNSELNNEIINSDHQWVTSINYLTLADRIIPWTCFTLKHGRNSATFRGLTYSIITILRKSSSWVGQKD